MKHIFYSLIAICTALGFTACDDDDNNWAPGEAESADSPGVFFTDDNDYSFEFESGMGEETFELHLKRLNATNAVTVPLTATVDDSHIVVPSSVDFAAGETEATITVNCEGLPERQTFNFSIAVADGYKTAYGKGSDTYQGTVAVVSWVTLDPNFKYTYYNSSSQRVYTATYGEWQLLEGSNKMKLTNFMNSGKDFMFTLDSTQSGCSTTYIGINPIYNFYYDTSATDYGCWYFYDDANQVNPSWTMADGEPVYYLYVYGVGYSYFNLNDGYGCFSTYFVPDEEANEWNWIYVWCYFTIPDEYVGNIPYTK
jgi:hypothetical protein